MNNTNGEEYKAAFKKAYLSLKDAVRLNYAMTGLDIQHYSSERDLVDNLFKKRMSGGSFYFPEDYFENMIDSVSEYASVSCDTGDFFMTDNGTVYGLFGFRKDRNETTREIDCWVYFLIDVNGAKKPNKLTLNSDNPQDQYIVKWRNGEFLPSAAAEGVLTGTIAGGREAR